MPATSRIKEILWRHKLFLVMLKCSIKLAYHPRWPVAQLTASAITRLGQYASSGGYRTYCHAELAVFFPGYCQKYLFVLTHKGMARLSWPGWLAHTVINFCDQDLNSVHGYLSPISILTGPGVEQLCHYHSLSHVSSAVLNAMHSLTRPNFVTPIIVGIIMVVVY